ncbi:hypothetical protein B0H19DRAFT_1289733 [Mycena capillaripes]|nr:hypothetical protein B0H19DRAFT_1289733 [Mycena capillaripes]
MNFSARRAVVAQGLRKTWGASVRVFFKNKFSEGTGRGESEKREQFQTKRTRGSERRRRESSRSKWGSKLCAWQEVYKNNVRMRKMKCEEYNDGHINMKVGPGIAFYSKPGEMGECGRRKKEGGAMNERRWEEGEGTSKEAGECSEGEGRVSRGDEAREGREGMEGGLEIGVPTNVRRVGHDHGRAGDYYLQDGIRRGQLERSEEGHEDAYVRETGEKKIWIYAHKEMRERKAESGSKGRYMRLKRGICARKARRVTDEAKKGRIYAPKKGGCARRKDREDARTQIGECVGSEGGRGG